MPVIPNIFFFFTPKVHPRVCWVIFIILQLQRTAIENSRIDKIDTTNMVDRIYCINQYEDNQYGWSGQLTLQTPPTQLRHCCLLFWFAWFIKLRSIVVLYPVSYCWHTQFCFLCCFCLPLNTTVVPTAEVRLLSQWWMAYCFVYNGHMVVPGFLLIT